MPTAARCQRQHEGSPRKENGKTSRPARLRGLALQMTSLGSERGSYQSQVTQQVKVRTVATSLPSPLIPPDPEIQGRKQPRPSPSLSRSRSETGSCPSASPEGQGC